MRLPGEKVEEARRLLEETRFAGVLTGAGVSAESGVPTFRGKDGLWKQFRAEELATPEAFARDPGLVWEWYRWRRNLIREKEPNPAHRALVELEKRILERGGEFGLITQNVDGLHEKAGSRRVIPIHGNIWEVRCADPACGWKKVDRGELDPLPRCPECGGLARPGVVWFGEALPEEALVEVERILRGCDLFLVAGTSGVVQPAASFAWAARRRGAKVIEVNLVPTPLTQAAHLAFHGPAGEILPRLV